MPPELVLLSGLRALVEVALLCMLGQGLLAVLAGRHREGNAIYKLFVIVTAPVLKIIRKISPLQIIDRHLPLVAFFVLLWGWIGLAWIKKLYCDARLLQCF